MPQYDDVPEGYTVTGPSGSSAQAQQYDDVPTGYTVSAPSFYQRNVKPFAREVVNGVPFVGDYLAPKTPEMQDFEQRHPHWTTGAHVAGGILGTAPLVAVAPEAFGAAASWPLLARIGAGAATGGTVSRLDAYSRGATDDQADRAGKWGAIFGSAGPAAGYAGGKIAGASADYAQEIPRHLAQFSPETRQALIDTFAKENLSAREALDRLMQLEKSGQPLSEFGPETSRLARLAERRVEGRKDELADALIHSPSTLERVGETLSHVYNPEVTYTQIPGMMLKTAAQAATKGRNARTPQEVADALAQTGPRATNIGYAANVAGQPASKTVSPVSQAMLTGLLQGLVPNASRWNQ